MTRGQSPQASVVLEPDGLQPAPDLRDVLDPDPVQLHVLPVGDVGGVAREVDRDLADHPQLLGGQGAAVDADPEHEVLVVELVRLERGGLAAVDAGLALGVEAVPAEASAQVARVDRGEAAVGVDVLDPRPHVQRVVVLLGLLVRVQRLAVAERPLALARGGAGWRAAGVGGRGSGAVAAGRAVVGVSVSSGPRSWAAHGCAAVGGGVAAGHAGDSAASARPDTSSTRSDRGRRSVARSAPRADARSRQRRPGLGRSGSTSCGDRTRTQPRRRVAHDQIRISGFENRVRIVVFLGRVDAGEPRARRRRRRR